MDQDTIRRLIRNINDAILYNGYTNSINEKHVIVSNMIFGKSITEQANIFTTLHFLIELRTNLETLIRYYKELLVNLDLNNIVDPSLIRLINSLINNKDHLSNQIDQYDLSSESFERLDKKYNEFFASCKYSCSLSEQDTLNVKKDQDESELTENAKHISITLEMLAIILNAMSKKATSNHEIKSVNDKLEKNDNQYNDWYRNVLSAFPTSKMGSLSDVCSSLGMSGTVSDLNSLKREAKKINRNLIVIQENNNIKYFRLENDRYNRLLERKDEITEYNKEHHKENIWRMKQAVQPWFHPREHFYEEYTDIVKEINEMKSSERQGITKDSSNSVLIMYKNNDLPKKSFGLNVGDVITDMDLNRSGFVFIIYKDDTNCTGVLLENLSQSMARWILNKNTVNIPLSYPSVKEQREYIENHKRRLNTLFPKFKYSSDTIPKPDVEKECKIDAEIKDKLLNNAINTLNKEVYVCLSNAYNSWVKKYSEQIEGYENSTEIDAWNPILNLTIQYLILLEESANTQTEAEFKRIRTKAKKSMLRDFKNYMDLSMTLLFDSALKNGLSK